MEPLFIEGYYREWLFSLIGYLDLDDEFTVIDLMMETDFIIANKMDVNRADDGRALRIAFLEEKGEIDNFTDDDPFFSEPCSVLEFLVSMAMRMSDNVNVSTYDIFWELFENLLPGQYDIVSFDQDITMDRIKAFMYRNYNKNGRGGIFPLLYPKEDQRKVELWYQMQEYIDEKYPYSDEV